jgi:hypothetical protein
MITPKQDIERLGDLIRRQKRGNDDEQQRDDIERKQAVAEADAFRRRAFVQSADAPSHGGN